MRYIHGINVGKPERSAEGQGYTAAAGTHVEHPQVGPLSEAVSDKINQPGSFGARNQGVGCHFQIHAHKASAAYGVLERLARAYPAQQFVDVLLCERFESVVTANHNLCRSIVQHIVPYNACGRPGLAPAQYGRKRGYYMSVEFRYCHGL